MPDPTDYRALREAASRATKGPWTTEWIAKHDVRVMSTIDGVDDRPVAWCAANHGNAESDAAYLALLDPATVLRLVERAELADRLEAMERDRWASAEKALGVPPPSKRLETP